MSDGVHDYDKTMSLFERPRPEPTLMLSAGQSLALRRMIAALKNDEKLYEACPDPVRTALADILLPPYSSAEEEILALQGDRDEMLKLIERFGSRIRDLEKRQRARS